MKKIGIMMVALMAMLVCSCSGGAGIEKLLQSVPESTSAVGVFNLQSLSEKAGNVEKDGRMDLSAEMKNFITSMGPTDAKDFQAFFSGESGIELNSAVCYEYQGEMYMTGYVDDEKQLAEFLTKHGGAKFTETDGAYVSQKGNAVIRDGRWWYTSGKMTLQDAEAFAGLKKEESILDLEYGRKLADSDRDMEFFAVYDKLLTAGEIPMDKVMQARLLTSTLFKEAKYIAGGVEFKKGKAEAELEILDINFKPSQFSIKMGKISKKQLKAFNGRGDLYLAAAVSEEALDNIAGQLGVLGMKGANGNILKSLDGNIVVGMNTDWMPADAKGMGALIGCRDKDGARALGQLFSFLPFGHTAATNVDGSNLTVNLGIPMGRIPDEVISEMSGHAIAMVYDPTAGAPAFSGWKSIVLTVDNKEAKIEIEAETKDKEKNALPVLLQTLASMKKK